MTFIHSVEFTLLHDLASIIRAEAHFAHSFHPTSKIAMPGQPFILIFIFLCINLEIVSDMLELSIVNRRPWAGDDSSMQMIIEDLTCDTFHTIIPRQIWIVRALMSASALLIDSLDEGLPKPDRGPSHTVNT